jgi:flagellar protein FlbD
MIELTRINDSPLMVNPDLIEFIERTPDTVISLTTGRKLMVRESVEEVVERIIAFRRTINGGPLMASRKSGHAA